MDKAIVLLSSYNGAEYIGAQIESIISQSYDNWKLIIRDDNSGDGTVDIIKDYCRRDSRIHLISDDKGNLGYPACFYELTDTAPDAEYYFFADQDDVWFPDKIERAIRMLSALTDNRPAAYYGGYTICDENLASIRTAAPNHPAGSHIKLKDTLFEVCGLEFTMAVNRKALKLLNSHKPSFSTGRGTWMSMLYSVYADIVFDEEPCAFYRRHESAVTASNQSFWGLWIWRFKYLFGGGFKDFHDIIKDFYQTVGPELDVSDRRLLRLFSGEKYFPDVITKVFYPKRLRSRMMDEMALRFAFLIGRI